MRYLVVYYSLLSAAIPNISVMFSARTRRPQFKIILTLLLTVPLSFLVRDVSASPPPLFQSTYQTIPTSLCNADIAVTADMGLISATQGPHKEANGEPGPYIYRPPQVPLDVENYPVAPAGLELEQVHVYVRHGACYLLFLVLS